MIFKPVPFRVVKSDVSPSELGDGRHLLTNHRDYLLLAARRGLEQAAHTFGIVRSLTLVGASFEIVVDCLAMGSCLSFQ